MPPTPVDPAVSAFLHGLRAQGPVDRDAVGVAEVRRASDELLRTLAGPAPPCGVVEDLEVPGAATPLLARVYRPAGPGPDWPGLLFFHGGGFTIGNLDTHDVVARVLAEEARYLVVSVAYRLAPEHPYPAAHDDARAVASWLASGACQLPVDRDRLAVFGDSAGGSLALAACRQLRRDGHRTRLRVLAYPVVDFRGETNSHRRHSDDGFLTSEATRWFLEQVLPRGADPRHPELCPVLARDLADSPPTYLVLAEVDPIVDDGRAYAAALRAAGATVEVAEYPDQTHGFLGMQAVTPRAQEGLVACGRALRQVIGGH